MSGCTSWTSPVAARSSPFLMLLVLSHPAHSANKRSCFAQKISKSEAHVQKSGYIDALKYFLCILAEEHIFDIFAVPGFSGGLPLGEIDACFRSYCECIRGSTQGKCFNKSVPEQILSIGENETKMKYFGCATELNNQKVRIPPHGQSLWGI